jgi:hypothetical protein
VCERLLQIEAHLERMRDTRAGEDARDQEPREPVRDHDRVSLDPPRPRSRMTARGGAQGERRFPLHALDCAAVDEDATMRRQTRVVHDAGQRSYVIRCVLVERAPEDCALEIRREAPHQERAPDETPPDGRRSELGGIAGRDQPRTSAR